MSRFPSYLTHESLFRGEDRLLARGDKKILVLGCGALGSWLGDLLARQGYNSLTVLDFDRVEEANFGTQCFGKGDLGRPKSAQCAANIFRRIGVKVIPINKKITQGTVKTLKGYDLVIDLFDNWESRGIVQDFCAKQRIACVHAGLAAMGFLQISWNETFEIGPTVAVDESGAPCEYPMASNLVYMCVAIVAEVINRFVDEGKKVDMEMWLKSFSTKTKVI